MWAQPSMENIHVAGDLLKVNGGEANVIVANILADILIHLTEDAYRLVKDEGYLIWVGLSRTSGTWCASRLSQLVFLETHDSRERNPCLQEG